MSSCINIYTNLPTMKVLPCGNLQLYLLSFPAITTNLEIRSINDIFQVSIETNGI